MYLPWVNPSRLRCRTASQVIADDFDHYEGREINSPSESVRGIKAYDVWCDAFRGRKVEPNGNAYNIAVIMDCRKYAGEFLKEVMTSWPQTEETDIRVRSLLGEAAELYVAIADNFYKLHQLYPFPQGGDPMSLRMHSNRSGSWKRSRRRN